MLKRLSVAAFIAALMAVLAGPATANTPNFWLDKGFMNMAHQGGELEAPANTLFAFKTAVKYRGADTLEMDGYLTKDKKFVITHDMEPHKTSDAPHSVFGSADPALTEHLVMNLTLEQLRQYDFAYKYTPGKGHYGYNAADPHPFRGIATGDKEPPAGFSRADFQIATIEQVLDAFPDTPLNIDMKAPRTAPQMADEAAEVVAEVMKRYPERSDDVIIASFFQGAMERFHQLAPDHRALTASEDALLGFLQSQPINPPAVALQPPDRYNFGGNWIDTIQFLSGVNGYDQYAVHVWGSDNDPLQETAPFYRSLLAKGVDGFFTQQPGELHQFLCEEGVRRPDGSQRCASQTPDPVPCPQGTVGTAPTCTPEPRAQLRLHRAKVAKRIAANSRASLSVLISNPGTADLKNVRVCVTVPARQRRSIKAPGCARVATVKPGDVVERNLRLRTTKRAKGAVQLRVRVTSANGGNANRAAKSTLFQKKKKSKSRARR